MWQAVLFAESGAPTVATPGQDFGVQSLIICFLAFGAAWIFSFVYWTQFAVSDSPGRRTLFGFKNLIWFVTTAGTAVLAGWGVKQISPLYGVAWIAGLVVGTVATRHCIVRDYSAGLETLPKAWRDEFRAFVRRNIFVLGHKQGEIAIKKKRGHLREEYAERQARMADAMHQMIHTTRDESAAYLGARAKLMRQFLRQHQDQELFRHHLRIEFVNHLRTALEKTLRLFEGLLVNPDGLWVAARLLSEGNSGHRVYKTILRVGHFNPDRAQHSIDFSEDEGFPAFLREEYDAGRGIAILNKNRKGRQWISGRNDQRNEDVSLMAGPVVVKTSGGNLGDEKREMLMILYVNSPNDNAFVDDYRDYLKCCTDTLSMFFSLAFNMDAETTVVRHLSPLTIPGK